jgi:hypothetical protein
LPSNTWHSAAGNSKPTLASSAAGGAVDLGEHAATVLLLAIEVEDGVARA